MPFPFTFCDSGRASLRGGVTKETCQVSVSFHQEKKGREGVGVGVCVQVSLTSLILGGICASWDEREGEGGREGERGRGGEGER